MSSTLSEKNDELWLEDVALKEVSKEFGTPCYVYSKSAIEKNFKAYEDALSQQKHMICFAVKANPNIAFLQILAKLGSGFDIVSIGELERVLVAGGDPKKVVFSGVGKNLAEMRRALSVGIFCFNIESESELNLLHETATKMGKEAPISIRVNPDIDAKTHPYVATGLKESKFGVNISCAEEIYARAANMTNIKIIGIDCHIGSQLTDIEPFTEALVALFAVVDRLKKKDIILQHIDIGGGLGVRYRDESPPSIGTYARSIVECFQQREETILLEPGRSIAADAGILLTRIEFLKSDGERNFAIVDAAMNDLLRPALYDAWMDIKPVTIRNGTISRYDVVGPVCETGDFLGHDRRMSIHAGDLLCICDAGAYGFTMGSNYNSRPRASEVIVSGMDMHLVRVRESIEDLFRGESLIPEVDQQCC